MFNGTMYLHALPHQLWKCISNTQWGIRWCLGNIHKTNITITTHRTLIPLGTRLSKRYHVTSSVTGNTDLICSDWNIKWAQMGAFCTKVCEELTTKSYMMSQLKQLLSSKGNCKDNHPGSACYSRPELMLYRTALSQVAKLMYRQIGKTHHFYVKVPRANNCTVVIGGNVTLWK